jgi:myo-inositol 2-dehydrogenase / D-chiro-inositol 1-dehydrogenase
MKFCLIGCGEHAVSSHGPALALYAASHSGFELAACCDVDASRAQAFSRRFGFGRPYDDMGAMLDAERPDAAGLVVPVHLTCELASRVLSRGIPLLLEKPPGETAGDVDCLDAAARAAGRHGRPVPHQVAFNRRYVPVLAALRERVDRLPPGAGLQHVRYEMVRVDRRDPDFSTTAIHAIDAVRFICGSDFEEVRFRYQRLPDIGQGVANIFMDAVMRSGVTAHLSFCPMAGVVVERAEAHARDHTIFVEVPMWNGYDSPGRLVHLHRAAVVDEIRGGPTDDAAPVVLGGFYGEYEAFFDALAAGRPPAPSLEATRQSVQVAQAMRQHRREWRS